MEDGLLEKTLHSGNIAAAFGSLATASADLTLCGGALTTIGAALSGVALLKKDRAVKTLAEQMGMAFETALRASPISGGQKKLIPQIMQKYPLSEDDMAAGSMIAANVAHIIRQRIEDNTDNEDPALTGDALLKAYEAILTQTLEPALTDPVETDRLALAGIKELLQRTDGMADNSAPPRVKRTVALASAAKKDGNPGVGEGLLIALA